MATGAVKDQAVEAAKGQATDAVKGQAGAVLPKTGAVPAAAVPAAAAPAAVPVPGATDPKKMLEGAAGGKAAESAAGPFLVAKP
ncbi:MAG: hypothetical protein H6R48_746 [Proteobacteria bacterium]|nr:hypothetical protein [Pseudomonadota bacterium]